MERDVEVGLVPKTCRGFADVNPVISNFTDHICGRMRSELRFGVNPAMVPLEDIIKYIASRPNGIGYYPLDAGTDLPDMIERTGNRLLEDPRVADVTPRFHQTTGKLLQLKIEVDKNASFVCSHSSDEQPLRLKNSSEEHACSICGGTCRCESSLVLFE
jgi:hypothetical protein